MVSSTRKRLHDRLASVLSCAPFQPPKCHQRTSRAQHTERAPRAMTCASNPGKSRSKLSEPPRKQRVHLARLRHAGTELVRAVEAVALDDGHAREVIAERARRAHAGQARADHDGARSARGHQRTAMLKRIMSEQAREL